jgi:hypothetical protein
MRRITADSFRADYSRALVDIFAPSTEEEGDNLGQSYDIRCDMMSLTALLYAGMIKSH